MKSKTKQDLRLDEPEHLYTVEEAMDYLRVSRSTLYRMIRANHLRYYDLPIGGRRFKREDLDAVLIEGKPTEADESTDTRD